MCSTQTPTCTCSRAQGCRPKGAPGSRMACYRQWQLGSQEGWSKKASPWPLLASPSPIPFSSGCWAPGQERPSALRRSALPLLLTYRGSWAYGRATVVSLLCPPPPHSEEQDWCPRSTRPASAGLVEWSPRRPRSDPNFRPKQPPSHAHSMLTSETGADSHNRAGAVVPLSWARRWGYLEPRVLDTGLVIWPCLCGE